MATLDFKELKKQLRDVEKLSETNLDVNTWKSDLEVWIKYQQISDPKTIFMACILTTSGQPRSVIQEMETTNEENSDSEDDSDSEDSSDSESEEPEQYPSLKKVVSTLKEFYGLKENQNNLLREIRALRIRRNEKVKEFNVQYRSLYLKLDKKRRKQITILDYADSLQNNHDVWKKISMKDDIDLNQAFKIAEKVDRLRMRPKDLMEFQKHFRSNTHEHNHNKNNKSMFVNHKEIPKQKESLSSNSTDTEIDDLTRKMKQLSIRVCYYCKDEGHTQYSCPKLRADIAANKKEIMKKYLNH